jgi:ADP-ribose pyrophosphatase
VPAAAGAAAEREETRPLRVSIDAALAALGQDTMHNGLLVLALHWLALNRGRLKEIAGGSV